MQPQDDAAAQAVTDETWWRHGACRGHDPDIFFPERGASAEPARAICSTCPVIEPCLEYATTTPVRFGVWGGKSERQRKRIRERRRLRVVQ